MKFSAVIVTRGDVDLGPVIAPIVPLADELVIRRGHNGVWERWEAILAAKHDIVYTQDDDAIVDMEIMLARSLEKVDHPAGTILMPDALVCNMPEWKRGEYQDGTALVGWGAFAPKRLVKAALVKYRAVFNPDELFLRECDRVITGLSPLHLVDVPFHHAPWANGPNRMCAKAGDPKHAAARHSIRTRIESIRAQEKIHA